MEVEYKWKLASPEEGERLLSDPLPGAVLSDAGEIRMDAIYYDTPDGWIASLHGGLRLRQENGESVCCVKLDRETDGGCKVREEYEIPAETIEDGIRLLPKAGAPEEMSDRLLRDDLVELCRIWFLRRKVLLTLGGNQTACSAELAFDHGEASRNGKAVPILEAELEYKSGSVEAFHGAARAMQTDHGLVPQTISKLGQAMAL